MTAKQYVIAQLSDIHCGDPRFDETLMLRVIREINDAEPDLVIVPGDVTANGYREEFEAAAGYLDLLECDRRIVIAGNHDCRNVGYLLFESIFGSRNTSAEYEFGVDGEGAKLKVMAVDSNIPDLNDGVVGREKLARIAHDLGEDAAFRVFVLHHHLVSIPGTGRERNIVWDAGDVLDALRAARVQVVLAGHKHVPYVWPVAGMLVVTSGTAATHRTRGEAAPSHTVLRITPDEVSVTVRVCADGADRTESFPRTPSPPPPAVR